MKISRSEFKEIYFNYFKALCVVSYRCLNDMDKAQDIVQQVFLDLLENIESKKIDGEIYSYLKKAVYFKSIDWIRKEQLQSKYLESLQSDSYKTQMENWIKTDPKNGVYFIRFKQVFDTADSYALYDSIHVENRWKAFKQLSENRPAKGKVIQLSTKWMKIAASVFLFLILGVSSYYFYSQSQYITYEYSALHSSVSLPDSSVVYLEPGAKLSFNKDFNRKVSFEGEAFFDVKSNPDQVFMVDLHNSEIKVLGTSFNVKTGTLVEVKLYEGKLSFQSKFDSVIMKSGDRVKYDPGKEKVIRKQFADTTTFFEFKNEKLKNVFRVLEQRYLYKIDFSPDIADYQISGRFMLDTDITEILELLSTIIDIRYTIKKRHISIEVKTENNKNRNKNSLNHVESG